VCHHRTLFINRYMCTYVSIILYICVPEKGVSTCVHMCLHQYRKKKFSCTNLFHTLAHWNSVCIYYMYIWKNMYVCIFTCKCTHAQKNLSPKISTLTVSQTRILHIYVYMYVNIYNPNTRTCKFLYTYMYVYIHTYMYI